MKKSIIMRTSLPEIDIVELFNKKRPAEVLMNLSLFMEEHHRDLFHRDLLDDEFIVFRAGYIGYDGAIEVVPEVFGFVEPAEELQSQDSAACADEKEAELALYYKLKEKYGL